MTPMTPKVIPGGVKTMEQLMEQAVVVEITAHRLGEYRQLDANTVKIATFNRQQQDETTLTDDEKKELSLGKKILSAQPVADIRTLDRGFSELMRRRALPSPYKAGHYLIAREAFEEIDQMIRDYRSQREKLKATLRASLEEVVQVDKARLPKHLFNLDDYPTEEELDRRVYLEVHYVTYETPKSLRSLSQDAYERERRRAEQECKALMTELRDGLRASMKDFVTKLCSQLSTKDDGTKRRVYKNTLSNLKEFLDLFDNKNFAGDAELKSVVDSARKILNGVDASGLRENETFREQLSLDMNKLAVQVSDLSETVSARRYAV